MTWIAELIRELRANDCIEAPAVIICDAQSYATALCLDRLGRRFQPYVLDLGSGPDLVIPETVWESRLALKTLTPSTEQEASDFVRLVGKYNCATAFEIELGYMALSACSAVAESVVWLGTRDVRGRDRAWKRARAIALEFGKTLWAPRTQVGAVIPTRGLREFGDEVARTLDERIDGR